MARDPFSQSNKGVFSVGRVAVGLLVIGTLTFGFGYYMPLKDAHSALAQEHQSLNTSHSGTASQLKQTTNQLQGTQKARDELAAKLKQLEDAEQNVEQAVMSLVDDLNDKLATRIRNKQASVDKEDKAATVLVDEIRLYRGHQATVHGPGRAILCSVARALKGHDVKLQVSSHITAAEVENPMLRADYATTWELSAARAASAVQALQRCGVKPAQMVAVASAHHHPIKDAKKDSTGSLRIVVTP